jgi:bifunctional non-homologous end joining protein LigD
VTLDDRSRAGGTARRRTTRGVRRGESNRIPFRVRPMVATLVDEPFHRPGWVYEEKYDGYRILAYKEGGDAVLLSRNGLNRTESFSEIARAVTTLPDRTLLLDGEAVAFDRRHVSRFQLLQQGRARHVYAVFDCLYRNGRDLRREPLSVRRAELEKALEGAPPEVVPSRRLSGNGLTAYRTALRRGLEGVVAKDEESIYEERRGFKWLKVKVHQEEEFVIGGFTAPRGSREHLGALLLGAYHGKDLHFVGKVGTGFSGATLQALAKKLQPLVRARPPFVNPPREKNATWLAPRLVAQIAFQEWTSDAKLRQPVFLGLRDDKNPLEVQLPEGA